MPQGAPELPLIYAALIEELLGLAKAEMIVAHFPAGISMPADALSAWQVERARAAGPFVESDLAHYYFADGTCVLGSTPAQTTNGAFVVASVFSRASQILHAANSEVLYDSALEEGGAPRVTIWPAAELEEYRYRMSAARASSAQHEDEEGHCRSRLAVNHPLDVGQTMALRVRAAWHSWSNIREQARTKRIALRPRVQLLGAAFLPALFWGLESISMTKQQRGQISSLQRVMLGRMLSFSSDHERAGMISSDAARGASQRRSRRMRALTRGVCRNFAG